MIEISYNCQNLHLVNHDEIDYAEKSVHPNLTHNKTSAMIFFPNSTRVESVTHY